MGSGHTIQHHTRYADISLHSITLALHSMESNFGFKHSIALVGLVIGSWAWCSSFFCFLSFISFYPCFNFFSVHVYVAVFCLGKVDTRAGV